jgi:hypothetical protein
VASTRGNPDLGDIVRSTLVIALIILALFGLGKLFTTTPEQTVSAVDYQPIVTQARSATDLPLLAPATLPEGWRATSVRFDAGPDSTGGSWHLGVLTDDDEYVGVEQTPLSIDRAVERWADGSEESGSAQVAGQVWSVRAGPGDRITYVLREDDRTTLINGTVSQQVLEDYISSLSSSA